MKTKLSICTLLLLTGCTTSQNKLTWLEKIEGNEFRTNYGIIDNENDNKKYVGVYNTMKTWNGDYQGGAEKIPARKKLLESIADKEVRRVCGHEYKQLTTTYFEMTDKHENSYGGGLIGLAIAQMSANDENIPVSIYYQFTCKADSLNKNYSKDQK